MDKFIMFLIFLSLISSRYVPSQASLVQEKFLQVSNLVWSLCDGPL